MSEYDTIKNGIVTRLNGLGYKESDETMDFENVSSKKYDNSFIINCIAGELDSESSETMVDRIYDFQTWEIQIAFDKSSLSDVIQRDQLHRKKDEIIKDLDDPDNWSSFARILKYRNWLLEERENYFLLIIELEVQVQYTY